MDTLREYHAAQFGEGFVVWHPQTKPTLQAYGDTEAEALSRMAELERNMEPIQKQIED